MKFNSGGSKLGVLGFYAASHKAEQCGANGKAPPFAPPSFFLFLDLQGKEPRRPTPMTP